MTAAERSRRWRERHPERAKKDNAARRKRLDRREKIVWARILHGVINRCNYKTTYGWEHYGGKGIKCQITLVEVARLWFRDTAWMMDRPELDRINPNDHYRFDNCRFIPKLENLARRGKALGVDAITEGDTSFNVEEFERESA